MSRTIFLVLFMAMLALAGCYGVIAGPGYSSGGYYSPYYYGSYHHYWPYNESAYHRGYYGGYNH
jgi:uncharacterized protein YceK